MTMSLVYNKLLNKQEGLHLWLVDEEHLLLLTEHDIACESLSELINLAITCSVCTLA